MPKVICTHCRKPSDIVVGGPQKRRRAAETRPLTDADGSPISEAPSIDYAALWCRKCEHRGTLKLAAYCHETNQWVLPTAETGPDLFSATIEGRPITLTETLVLQDARAFCRARPKEWIADGEFFAPPNTDTRRAQRECFARLLAAGVLALAGLDVQPTCAGHALIRWPAAVPAEVSKEVS